MASTVNGRITYANGRVAQGVEVRVFDRDAPGKGDDDLTLTPGLSDAHGEFTVAYDPGRFQDFVNLSIPGLSKGGLRLPDVFDVLAPYLQFCYTFAGQRRVVSAEISPFQSEFRLPEVLPLEFRPSLHGFQFHNNFPGFDLPFSLPFLKGKTKIADPYGLCGGMSAGAADFLLAGRPIPANPAPPARRTRLHRYLFNRAIDSFESGKSILRFVQWMLLPDDTANGIRCLTAQEYVKVRAALDQHQLAPIGLLYYRPPAEREGRPVDKTERLQLAVGALSLNHQVLAYGYRDHPDGSSDILIYDPNGPGQDEVTVHAERVLISRPDEEPRYGLRCQQRNLKIGSGSTQFLHQPLVHGFFAMPYEPIEPPDHL